MEPLNWDEHLTSAPEFDAFYGYPFSGIYQETWLVGKGFVYRRYVLTFRYRGYGFTYDRFFKDDGQVQRCLGLLPDGCTEKSFRVATEEDGHATEELTVTL